MHIQQNLDSFVSLCNAASDDGVVYYPMFFTHERSFEEFYCICIQLVNKTWKEMKATSIDFAKVSGRYIAVM
jgi:hypothetical protein